MNDQGQDADDGVEPEPGQFYRIAWFFYLLLALAGLTWIGVREGRIPLALVFDPRRWWLDAGLGVAVGLVLVAAWRAGRRLLPAMRELEALLQGQIGPLAGPEVFALAVISGIAEEVFFRGALQGSLGWLWATVIFTAVHVGPGPAMRTWTVFAAVAGLVFAALTVWRGNILAALLAHFVVNWINLHGLLTGDPEASAEGG